jgi:hypothetical protein
VRSGTTRRACRGPSAPSAERARSGCPIAGAPAGFLAPRGSSPNRCRGLHPVEGVHQEARGGRVTSCLATEPRARPGAPRPLDVTVEPRRTVGPRAGADTRAESSSGWRAAPLPPTSPGVPSRALGRDGGCLARSLLPEGAETRCVVKGRANPTCQRAPENHADFRALGSASPRGRSASRRFTRFGSFAGRGVGVLDRCRVRRWSL